MGKRLLQLNLYKWKVWGSQGHKQFGLVGIWEFVGRSSFWPAEGLVGLRWRGLGPITVVETREWSDFRANLEGFGLVRAKPKQTSVLIGTHKFVTSPNGENFGMGTVTLSPWRGSTVPYSCQTSKVAVNVTCAVFSTLLTVFALRLYMLITCQVMLQCFY